MSTLYVPAAFYPSSGMNPFYPQGYSTPDKCSKGQPTFERTNSTKDNSPQFSDSSDKEDNLACNEIDVKPKRKIFSTTEERMTFIEDYKRKFKTEMCKNFQLKGTCRYGDKCSFAHGFHELKTKTHLSTHYKTKMCKQYHFYGFCYYGYRCQYIHKEKQFSDDLDEKLTRIHSLSATLFAEEETYQEALTTFSATHDAENVEEILNSMERPDRSRLSLAVFDEIHRDADNCEL
jgi:hypothetical protein